MFLGYCFDDEGWHAPAVHLDNAIAAYYYINVQHWLFHEIRICNADDDMVAMHVIDHMLVYPPPEEFGKAQAIDFRKVTTAHIDIIAGETNGTM